MTLYFQRSNHERLLLGEYDKDGILSSITKFLDDHHYTSYYTRIWKENNEIWFDVGSHTEFFVAIDNNNEWEIAND